MGWWWISKIERGGMGLWIGCQVTNRTRSGYAAEIIDSLVLYIRTLEWPDRLLLVVFFSLP